MGYYLVSDGIKQLYEALGVKKASLKSKIKFKTNVYIYGIVVLSIILSLMFGALIYTGISNAFTNNLLRIVLTAVLTILGIIPISEIVLKTIQIVLSKCVKPKMIPKMDFSRRCTKDK